VEEELWSRMLAILHPGHFRKPWMIFAASGIQPSTFEPLA